jgi:hypothetical protein
MDGPVTKPQPSVEPRLLARRATAVRKLARLASLGVLAVVAVALVVACGGERGRGPATPTTTIVTLDAGAQASRGGAFPAPSDCESCDGALTSALQTELMSRAGEAKSCYDRLLARRRGAEGHMLVRVRVGGTGAICSDKVLEDELHDEQLARCVLAMFEGHAGVLPAPAGGCVEVNVPLSFVRGDAGAGDDGGT